MPLLETRIGVSAAKPLSKDVKPCPLTLADQTNSTSVSQKRTGRSSASQRKLIRTQQTRTEMFSLESLECYKAQQNATLKLA